MRTGARLDDRTRAAPPRQLYDEDFALWVEEQVAALRAGDAAALDIQNLALELEGLTRRDERALGSQLKRIMAHMLKQRYQPERASRSWQDSIEYGREEIADILEQSPSLRQTLPGLMDRNCPRAIAQANRGRRLSPNALRRHSHLSRYWETMRGSEPNAVTHSLDSPVIAGPDPAIQPFWMPGSGPGRSGLAAGGRPERLARRRPHGFRPNRDRGSR
jgi:hypothetical protein